MAFPKILYVKSLQCKCQNSFHNLGVYQTETHIQLKLFNLETHFPCQLKVKNFLGTGKFLICIHKYAGALWWFKCEKKKEKQKF